MLRARLRPALVLAALALAGAAVPWQVRAQVPAAAPWQTLASAHFRVTFTTGLEPLARHAAAAAERARAALAQYLAEPPAGTVDIILSDNVDYSNGSSAPFPTNRIYLYAKPPVDAPDLNYLPDWMELVLAHELAHAFHLDATSRFGAALRRIFGRVPSSWPLFPAIGSPGWSVEGLAVAAESRLTGMGRLHGTYHDMVARTAALEDGIDDIDRLSSATPVWPGGQRTYVYGSLFIRHLQQQNGADAARRIVSASTHAVIPPALWFDRVGRRALGVEFRTAYDAWRDTSARRYRALADTLSGNRGAGPPTDRSAASLPPDLGTTSPRADLGTAGLPPVSSITPTRTLAREGGFAHYPRWSRDGRFIAYARNDRRSTPELRVIDARSGAEAWSRRQNTTAAAAWLPDGALLTSDLEFVDRDHLYFRLRRFRKGSTSDIGVGGERLQDLDVSTDGSRGIAVENGGGTNRLVTFDPRTGVVTPLTPFAPGVQWMTPRWSPAADLIAVSRWSEGGRYDVVILDNAARVVAEVTHGIGVNASPAWSPDGRFVLFSSDRTGIANLYAYDRQRARLAQLTNVLTGAFQPDVSPDGRAVVFSAYHHDGFHIETSAFDTAAFREPKPARQPQLPEAASLQAAASRAPAAPLPTVRPEPAPAAMQALRSEPAAGVAEPPLALSAADSAASAATPYRPFASLAPHWWVPVVLEQESGSFVGASTGGEDLVGRHAWGAWAAVAGESGWSEGGAWYEYRGLPPIPGTGLQPSLQLAFARDWDRLGSPPRPGDPYVEEREGVLSARTVLLHRRYRTVANVAFGGELVNRRRLLLNAGGRRLLDPDDDLIGARITTLFNTAHAYPFSLSAEDGITVQLGARQRWDRSRSSGVNSQGDTLRFDGGEREFTAWSAGYLALGRVAFANAVLAVRASALLRDGPGATTHGVGGTSGGSLPLGGVAETGTAQFLPVRGFPAGARRGTRAWSATAELRVPVALLAFKPRPLPFYLDRLGAAAFVDGGDASCAADEPCNPEQLGPALLGAGAEVWLDTSVLGAGFLLRAGGAVPVRGAGSGNPRWYLQVGTPF